MPTARGSLPLLLLSTLVLTSACGKHEAPVAPAAAPPGAATAAPFAIEGDIVPGGHCALDAVNGMPPVAGGATVSGLEPVTFAGWVGDAAGAVPASAHLLLAGGSATYALPLSAGGARPDVAAALGQPALETSGFNLSGSLQGVPAGSYVTSILMGDGTRTRCELNVTVVLTGA